MPTVAERIPPLVAGDRLTREEFLRRWDAGEFADDDRPEVVSVWMMLPLAR